MLAQKLSEMTPQDSDAYLANVWKQFRSTEAFEAVMMLFVEANKEAEQALLDPGTDDRKRAYSAGQCAILKRLLTSISAALAFDPTKATYSPTLVEGDEEVPADDSQII